MASIHLKLVCLALVFNVIRSANLSPIEVDSANLPYRLTFQEEADTSKEFPCPAAIDISPCVCIFDEEERLSLICQEIQSSEQLASVFQSNFPVTDYYLFRLQNSTNVTYLTDVFNGLTFEDVDLYDNGALELISDEFLIGSTDTLQNLYVHNSSLHRGTFPFLTLTLYSNLGRLDLRYSGGLTSIPKLTSNTLLYVSFAGSAIETLDPGTFDGIPNALEIHLEDNRLGRLDASTFQLTNETTVLELRDNNISYLDPSAILPAEDSEPNDVRLLIDLSGNALTSLEAGTFQFTRRPFILNLDRNFISDIVPGTFVLPSNTDSFSLELRLSQNQLTQLPEDVFGDLFPYLTVLQLYGNPLECGCDISWIVLNSINIEKIGNLTTCHDGVNIHDLNPSYYEEFC